MLRHLTPLGILSITLLAADFCQGEELMEVRFAGTLSQPAAGGDQVLRNFEALLLSSPDRSFFQVLDDEREGCPWPETYGQLQAADSPAPHLMYEYDGNAYSIALPPLALNLPADATEGTKWISGVWTFELVSQAVVSGKKTWDVTASERRGRRQTLKVTAETGILLAAKQDVFMGQGDKFELAIKQTSSKPVTDSVAVNVSQLEAQLIKLQRDLNRRPDSQLTELSPRQIETATSRLDDLSAIAKGTPLQEAVLRIRRDVERQSRRVAEAMNRQQQLLNKPAPSYSLDLVSGGRLESDSLKGKTVVLHFWKYAEKPLSEPYGQVGYLEFLYNKRKQSGVEVIGIAMNPALQQADTSRAGKRTARKLMEFMNLSYPVGYDDGSLLRAFGDPRMSGGELPLWIVVSRTGQIAHYHGGFYEVDQRQGLKELDDVLQQQTKTSN